MKHIKVEKLILFLAAGFASYNFGLAGGLIEGSRFSVGGLVAGVVVNVSLALASSGFGSLNGKKRTRQALVAFLAMLTLSPLLVSPVIYYSLPAGFLGSPLLRAVWSVAWPLVADLAIVLSGAVAGRSLISLSEPQKPAERPQNVARAKKKSAERPLSEIPCRYAGAGCGRTFASQNAANAHARNCGYKPVVIDRSLLIRKGGEE